MPSRLMSCRRIVVFLGVSMVAVPRGGTAAPASSADYTIRVALDPDARRMDAVERVRWHNRSAGTAGEIRLYLYYNAHRSRATTWMIEAAASGVDLDRVDRSAIDLTSLRLADSNRDLLADATFISPDDGNRDDRSVLRVALPAPIAPGGELVLDARWTATIPRDASAGGMFVVAHWFPQLAVLADTGWIAHQCHYQADVLSDVGTYDVSIEAPDRWQIAAGGREAAASGSQRTHRFVLADARDFAWAASRSWVERRERIQRDDFPPVDVRLLVQPEHVRQTDRLISAVRVALRAGRRALVPYTYSDLTIVDRPWRSQDVGGAFPGLLMTTIPWMEPARATDLETSLATLIAQHFWRAVVGGATPHHPWLLDGLTTYTAARLVAPMVQRQLDSPSGDGFLVHRFFGGFVPYVNRSVRLNLVMAETAGGSRRAARSLRTLERYLGSPTLEAILLEFVERYRLGHPSPEDFFTTAEATSGRNLQWFFDDVYRRQRVFDYSIERVVTEPVADGSRYSTSIVVTRHGDGVFAGTSRPRVGPYQAGRAVEVEVEFADGTVEREHWDGRDRSVTFSYESVSPVERVRVDPDRTLLLDTNVTNNSWTRTPRGGVVATRWAARWLTWLEDLLLNYSCLV
jgi:hypothetical protein